MFTERQCNEKTTFITKYGLFEYTRMPFGLCNAPSTFQRAMEVVLRGLQWRSLLVYLDDVIILGKDVDDNLQNLAEVLGRMQHYGLKLKPSKCRLLRDEVLFLGHVVSGQGIGPNPELIKTVQTWSPPKNLTELQAFVGLCNYYRRFVKDFAEICSPLHELQNKGAEFIWGEAQQNAFVMLKDKLVTHGTHPVLPYRHGTVCTGHRRIECRHRGCAVPETRGGGKSYRLWEFPSPSTATALLRDTS